MGNISDSKSDSTLEESNADRTHRRGIREHSLVLLTSCSNPLAPSQAWSLEGVTSLSIGRGDEQKTAYSTQQSGRTLQITLDDKRLSRMHTFLERVGKHWLVKDAKSRNGTLLNGVQIESGKLTDGHILTAGRSFFLFRTTSGHLPTDTSPFHPNLCTLNPQLHEVFTCLAKLATSKMELVIEGASGTGKERTARAIHDISQSEGSFVVIHCGAATDAQAQTPLYADDSTDCIGESFGPFQLAQNGTLFIDEVADLSEESQSMLLRALQQREHLNPEDRQSDSLNFRLICATRHRLEERVREGKFHEDLYAQINGYTARMPPLYGHREDLGILIAALLPKQAEGNPAQTFTIEAMLAILRHDWPRNIRELEKALAVGSVLAEGAKIELHHLPESLSQFDNAANNGQALDSSERERKAELERLLARNAGNVSAVARDFGKGRTQIVRWIARYNLDASSYRA